MKNTTLKYYYNDKNEFKIKCLMCGRTFDPEQVLSSLIHVDNKDCWELLYIP